MTASPVPEDAEGRDQTFIRFGGRLAAKFCGPVAPAGACPCPEGVCVVGARSVAFAYRIPWLAFAKYTSSFATHRAWEPFMLSRSTTLGLSALALVASSARAQQPTGQMELDCSRFSRNPDGSWSVNQPLELFSDNGRVRISPGPPFKRGMSFGGLDIAKMLDRQCR